MKLFSRPHRCTADQVARLSLADRAGDQTFDLKMRSLQKKLNLFLNTPKVKTGRESEKRARHANRSSFFFSRGNRRGTRFSREDRQLSPLDLRAEKVLPRLLRQRAAAKNESITCEH